MLSKLINRNVKIRVRNERAAFAILWLEPWGEDYEMFPEEEFDVIAVAAEKDFYFHVDFSEKDMKVWAEGDARFVAVYKDGEMLNCGHNRQE